ncbi:MAG TPA: DUF2784 domain-containing protein [Gammaproteobacteria bacterium]|nr:DUF2784 domain-containing protein [Gammaproteobacteria bacterium]
MSYALAADVVLVLHLAFIAFVALGALLALRWRWIALVQLPAAAWGAATELLGWVCPLTPLEQRLRALAGEASYSDSFIENYLAPLIYPAGLTPGMQIWLGVGVLVVNAVLYAWLWRRWAGAPARAE